MNGEPHRRLGRLWGHWWFVLAVSAIGAIGVAAGVSAIFCTVYWGYVLAPPGVDPRVVGATRVLSQRTISFNWFTNDVRSLQLQPHGFVDLAYLESTRDGDGAARLVAPRVNAAAWREEWVRRGVMPEDGVVAPMEAERCRGLVELIENTGRLVEGAYGDGFPDIRASISAYELLGPRGEPLLFLAVSTGELSNDHLGRYELLYDDSESPPRLIGRRHWRFDVAGWEGMEFAGCTLGLSSALLSMTMPVAVAVLAYRAFSTGGRIRRGRCPRCAYDLCGEFESGCPECGWARGPTREHELQLRRYTLAGRGGAVLTRAPGWRTLMVVAIAALLVWYGQSMPGGVEWAKRWGMLLFQAGVVLLAVKGLGAFVTKVQGRVEERRGAARFSCVVVLLSLSLVGARSDLPMRGRLAVSQGALKRVIEQERATGFPNRGPAGINTVAGLFVVRGVVPTEDGAEGVIVWVGDAGGWPVMRGFAWYPDGPPAAPSVYKAPIELHREVAPGWYLWSYWPDR